MSTEIEWAPMKPWPEDMRTMRANDPRWKEVHVDHRQKSHAWMETLRQGDVVHYNHGFGAWVRCEVVEHPLRQTASVDHDFTIPSLVPLAMVGPQWPRDHQSTRDHWIQKIAVGEAFQPHASNVYESPYWKSWAPRPEHGDPTTMEVWTP